MPMAKNSSTVRTSLESASMSFAVESKWREGVSALRHVSKIRLGTCRAHVDPAHPSEKPGYPQSIEEIFPTRSWDATLCLPFRAVVRNYSYFGKSFQFIWLSKDVHELLISLRTEPPHRRLRVVKLGVRAPR